jgi:tetratricopeptide (TPR) repeat protein
LYGESRNPLLYRDYAIALARAGGIVDMGYIQAAAELLAQIEGMGISGDSIDLLKGEIAYARREYNDAIMYFNHVIANASDDYIKYRAYIYGDRAYRQSPLGYGDGHINMLSNALGELPLEYRDNISERLAFALSEAGLIAFDNGNITQSRDYLNRAMDVFAELDRRGFGMYHIRQNIGILCQQMGDLNTARTVFENMLRIYPNEYNVYKRLVSLTIDEQRQISLDDRDYTETFELFAKAEELYRTQTHTDTEMQALRIFIDELIAGNW